MTSFGAIFAIGLGASLCGCSGSRDDLREQLSRMERELAAVRAAHDRMEERLEAVELSATVTARAVEEQRKQPERLERPPLKVIRLEPDASGAPSRPSPSQSPPRAQPEPEAADSEGSRPVIKGQGDRVIKTGGDGDGGSAAHQPIGISASSAVARAHHER